MNPEVEAVRSEYEQILMGVRVELQDSEAERRRLLRKTKALETELTKQRGNASRDNGDQEYFDLWVKETKRDSKRTVFGEERQKVVRKARELYESEEGDELCRRAIVGVAKFPYVSDGKRVTTGKPNQRYDELELILRNEVNIEKFARLATQEREPEHRPVAEPRRREHPRGRQFDPVHELSNALGRAGCKIRGNPYNDRKWVAQCPAHEDRNPSLSITQQSGKVLLYCYAGCATARILEVLDLEWCDLFSPDFQHAEIVEACGPPPADRLPFDTIGIEWGGA